MKGIILAGGKGSRLYPLTIAISKQLLPIYDKPMIYYPIATLMLSGIREMLIICTPEMESSFRKLLGSGRQWGVDFQYKTQMEPKGLPEAFLIGKEFIGKDSVCLILGDNIFYGSDLISKLRDAAHNKEGAVIFTYKVKDPSRYGIVEADENFNVLSLEEKPKYPKSNYAITGIYFFDNHVVNYAEAVRPSERGELEIIDVMRQYLKKGKLGMRTLGRGVAWLDAGTHQAMLQASSFIQTVQERQGVMVSSPEEIAYRMNYIDKTQLNELAMDYPNGYGDYLNSILSPEIK